jgi:hypothetical protein
MTISMYISTELLRSLHTQDEEHVLAGETLRRRKPDDGCVRRQARRPWPRRYRNRRPLHLIGALSHAETRCGRPKKKRRKRLTPREQVNLVWNWRREALRQTHRSYGRQELASLLEPGLKASHAGAYGS